MSTGGFWHGNPAWDMTFDDQKLSIEIRYCSWVEYIFSNESKGEKAWFVEKKPPHTWGKIPLLQVLLKDDFTLSDNISIVQLKSRLGIHRPFSLWRNHFNYNETT